MQDADSYRQFLREADRHEQTLDRFYQRMEAWLREHPEAGRAEVIAQIRWLEVVTPGLTDAIRYESAEMAVTLALIRDRGDGLPCSGPSAEWHTDGDRFWRPPEEWTLDDYRLNLAWYREPGAPAAQLAALLAYGQARWPGEDFGGGPWPDTSDLPDWADLALSLNQEIGPEDEDKDDA